MAHSTAPGERRTILKTLANMEALLVGIHDLLVELLSQEDQMAAEQSAEAQALDDAIVALQAELADVGAVDGEIVADLEGIQAAIGKVGPVSVEQVNAVTAVTDSLASLTAKLKAAGQTAAAVEAGAGAAPAPAEGVPAEATGAPAPPEGGEPSQEAPPPAPPAEGDAPAQ